MFLSRLIGTWFLFTLVLLVTAHPVDNNFGFQPLSPDPSKWGPILNNVRELKSPAQQEATAFRSSYTMLSKHLGILETMAIRYGAASGPLHKVKSAMDLYAADRPFTPWAKVPPVGHRMWMTIGASLRRQYHLIGAAILTSFEPTLSQMITNPNELERLRAWSKSDQEASYEELSEMLWKLVFEGIGAKDEDIDQFSKVQRYTTSLDDSHPKPAGTMPRDVAHKQSWGTLQGINAGKSNLSRVRSRVSSGRTTSKNSQRQ